MKKVLFGLCALSILVLASGTYTSKGYGETRTDAKGSARDSAGQICSNEYREIDIDCSRTGSDGSHKWVCVSTFRCR